MHVNTAIVTQSLHLPACCWPPGLLKEDASPDVHSQCPCTRLPEQCCSRLTCLVADLFPNKAVVFRPVCMMPAADKQMLYISLTVSTLQVQLTINIAPFLNVSRHCGMQRHHAGKPSVRIMCTADRPAVGSCMLVLQLRSKTLRLVHSSQPQYICNVASLQARSEQHRLRLSTSRLSPLAVR